MTAKFQADETFSIKNRGLVLSGRIIEGEVKKDMIVSIPFFPRILKIEGFEFIHAADVPVGLIGLFFTSVDDRDTALWEALDVKDKIFEIVDSSLNNP